MQSGCAVVCAVLKLLKMARSVRMLLDTVMQALPEVGNLGLLFFLLFYIFAALGVELFGRIGEQLNCCYPHKCFFVYFDNVDNYDVR